MSTYMTRRHFVFIAETLRCDLRHKLEPECYERVVNVFADALRRTNGRFNEDRFLTACHPRESA